MPNLGCRWRVDLSKLYFDCTLISLRCTWEQKGEPADGRSGTLVSMEPDSFLLPSRIGGLSRLMNTAWIREKMDALLFYQSLSGRKVPTQARFLRPPLTITIGRLQITQTARNLANKKTQNYLTTSELSSLNPAAFFYAFSLSHRYRTVIATAIIRTLKQVIVI